jgi:hypothetical protein
MLVPVGSDPGPPSPDPFARPVLEFAPPGRPVEGGERVVPTPRNAALLDALQRLARGEETSLLRPAQLAAVIARLLVKHGLIDEAELLEELARK